MAKNSTEQFLKDLEERKKGILDVDGIKYFSEELDRALERSSNIEKVWNDITAHVRAGEEQLKVQQEIDDLTSLGRLTRAQTANLAKLRNQLAELKRETGQEIRDENELLQYQARYADVLVTLQKKRKEADEEAKKIEKELTEELEKQIKHRREGVRAQEQMNALVEKTWINTKRLSTGIQDIKEGFSKLKGVVKDVYEPWAKADQAASDYTKAIGGNIQSMRQLRKETIDYVYAAKGKIGMEALIKLQGDYNKNIGRAINLTNEQREAFTNLNVVVGEQKAIDFTTKLERFGLAPEEAAKRVGQMWSVSTKHGIVMEKYSDNFLSNIQMAQNYTFSRGLKGLQSMAEKATAIKLDMQQASRFADKVSTLEGATTAGAQLSVLGGSFAQYGNPLSMLYEGLNDMEGMQDRIVNMFGDLGKWDNEKGQVDVSAFNRQRIKAAAEATGMDYSNLMEMINTNARRNLVGKQLGAGYDEDTRELLKNLGQIDSNGQAYVTIGGQRESINGLSGDKIQKLKDEHKSETELLSEIVDELKGAKDIDKYIQNGMEAGMARGMENSGLGERFKHFQAMALDNLDKLVAGKFILTGIQTLVGAILMAMGAITAASGVAGYGKAWGKTPGGVSKGGATAVRGRVNADGSITGKIKGGGTATWNAKAGRWQDSHGRFVAGSKIKGGVGGGGMSVGTSLGVGIGGAALGAGGSMWENHINNSVASGEMDVNNSGYMVGKIGSKALEWGGMGLSLGAMTGNPLIAGIAGGVGALAGGIYGGITAGHDRSDAAARQRYRERNGVDLRGSNYNHKELTAIGEGANAILQISGLSDKMRANGDPIHHTGTSGMGIDTTALNVVGRKMGYLKPNESYFKGVEGEVMIPREQMAMAVKAGKNPINNIKVTDNMMRGMNSTVTVNQPTRFEYKIDWGQGMTETLYKDFSERIKHDTGIKSNMIQYAAMRYPQMQSNGVYHKDNGLYPYSNNS